MPGVFAPIDLADVAQGQGGFVIHGQDRGDNAGGSVASAGDVNGDDFDDLIIGARSADDSGNVKEFAGAAWLVFGKAGSFDPAIDLAEVARGHGPTLPRHRHHNPMEHRLVAQIKCIAYR